ncbi:MMPL family transporter [Streptomyces yunnanensis]|uniref:MMPL family transporter n=1 Tax=Streptomyces yunnanensis TaxID=156453 RepID=A0ABY8AHK7_9ACTN|nr:MMPL family transporter [Streptomyces yunnanensis]WEB44483.1 MMPL family transporter [Streptomyces yunnanensis]
MTDRLSSGGYEDSAAESTRAERVLAERFGAGSAQLLLVARAPAPVTDPSIVAAGRHLGAELNRVPGVTYAQSVWNTSDIRLKSSDGRAALIRVRLDGDNRQVARHYDAIVDQFTGRHGVFTISATGTVVAQREVAVDVRHDLVRSEALAVPLVAVVLVWVFGSLVAAAVPLVVGAFGLAATTAVLAALTRVTEVSFFALNITTALGFALAVDYSLILVSRFRQELAAGHAVPAALEVTVATAGRTVAYSAATVLLSVSGLALFPMGFFRSLCWAALSVVVFAAGAALTVVPALLSLLGHGIDRGRLRTSGRSAVRGGRSAGECWAALARWVIGRPGPVLLAATSVLLVLAAPALGVRFGGTPYDWWTAPQAQWRMSTEQIQAQFPLAGGATPRVVLPDTPPPQARAYTAELSRLPGVLAVGGPGGVYRAGHLQRSYGEIGRSDARGTWVAVVTPFASSIEQARHLVQQLRAHPAPGPVLVGGDTAALIDGEDAVGGMLGPVALVIVCATGAVLWAFTGSVVLPLKALVMNSLSFVAAFGAAVWVFQNGHLAGLVGASARDSLDMRLPALLACIAFGIGMDYELWLVSRVAETYWQTGETRASVVAGLRDAGPLISASALILLIVTGALATAQVPGIKLMGFTFAAALVIDLMLVRGLVMPAFMAVAGRWNWWPRRLDRYGGAP